MMDDPQPGPSGIKRKKREDKPKEDDTVGGYKKPAFSVYHSSYFPRRGFPVMDFPTKYFPNRAFISTAGQFTPGTSIAETDEADACAAGTCTADKKAADTGGWNAANMGAAGSSSCLAHHSQCYDDPDDALRDDLTDSWNSAEVILNEDESPVSSDTDSCFLDDEDLICHVTEEDKKNFPQEYFMWLMPSLPARKFYTLLSEHYGLFLVEGIFVPCPGFPESPLSWEKTKRVKNLNATFKFILWKEEEGLFGHLLANFAPWSGIARGWLSLVFNRNENCRSVLLPILEKVDSFGYCVLRSLEIKQDLSNYILKASSKFTLDIQILCEMNSEVEKPAAIDSDSD